jgi:hypothetical protein
MLSLTTVIASRLTMGFGTLCSLDITIPFAEIDGRGDGFVTDALCQAVAPNKHGSPMFPHCSCA